MAYYYVKHTGSSTTAGGTTKKTGPFSGLVATAVYGSIKDAITYGAGSGDTICVSDASYTTGGNSLTWQGPTSGVFMYITCVEDLQCEVSSIAPSIQEDYTGSADISIKGLIRLYGLQFRASDNIQFYGTYTNLIFESCTLHVSGSSDILLMAGSDDGLSVTLINTDLIGISTSIGASMSRGTSLYIDGGSVSGLVNYFSSGGFGTGGCTMVIKGFDLSSITGTIIANTGNSVSGDSHIDVTIHSCKINANAVFLNETLTAQNHRLEAYNSAATSVAAEYQFYIEAYGGKVEDQPNSGIYRDESIAFPSGTKVSASCLTDANASLAAPFWFELPARYAELSTATDTLRVYLTSETALDDTDVWVEALYADGTNKHEQHYITTQNPDRMIVASAGTALTTDSGSTWKDGASDIAGTFNEYYIDIDTSGNAGADCVPMIKINVAIPSTQIYFDTVVDVV